MKVLGYLVVLFMIGCNSNERKHELKAISEVQVETVYEDSISIRAIEIMGDNIAFAGNNGVYGLYEPASGRVRTTVQKHDSLVPEFRAVASTSIDFFMLSIGNPALLYKTGDNGNMELVYKEVDEKVFYDAMIFWDDQEGIAMGDPTEDCLSVLITRDGGQQWEKLPCSLLPEAADGEAAFAASNSNIAVWENHTWILSGGMKSRVFYSPDRGRSWEVFDTPLVQGSPTSGGYSIDFYDSQRGAIIGGDYTNPSGNTANKAITQDGGKTWELISDGQDPGYKSSIRYRPNSQASEMVAVGFTGISYTMDSGHTWKTLSEESFYTLRFLNDSIAYAAGKNRIARLRFK